MIMNSVPDENLSESLMCRLADVNRQKRERWSKAGLLRRLREGYTARDLFDLVACKMLIETLGATDGGDAWLQIRGAYEAQLPTEHVDVLFSEADHEARLVRSPAELTDAVRHGRPVRVIDLGPEMTRVRGALERYRAGREIRSRADRDADKAKSSSASQTA